MRILYVHTEFHGFESHLRQISFFIFPLPRVSFFLSFYISCNIMYNTCTKSSVYLISILISWLTHSSVPPKGGTVTALPNPLILKYMAEKHCFITPLLTLLMHSPTLNIYPGGNTALSDFMIVVLLST